VKTREGAFREDLFYRLNVVAVALPSLRQRDGDIPLLVEHFLTVTAERLGRERKLVSPEAMKVLLAHDWKGNVRELEHAIEQAVVLASGEEIGIDDLPANLRDGEATQAGPLPGRDLPASFRDAKQQIVEEFERRFLVEALQRHGGNISRAAEDIGMYRQQLQQKLAELGIDAAEFRS
jgi:two-component system response regulator HydG